MLECSSRWVQGVRREKIVYAVDWEMERIDGRSKPWAVVESDVAASRGAAVHQEEQAQESDAKGEGAGRGQGIARMMAGKEGDGEKVCGGEQRGEEHNDGWSFR